MRTTAVGFILCQEVLHLFCVSAAVVQREGARGYSPKRRVREGGGWRFHTADIL